MEFEIRKLDVEFTRELDPIPQVLMLVQHHMGDKGERHTFFDIHRYHLDVKGWAGVGYNFLIDFDGTIYEARGYHIGAHAGSRYNARSLGIGYRGDFDHHEMTPEQVEAGIKLNWYLAEKYDLTEDDILEHGDLPTSTSACAGKNFKLELIKTGVADLLMGDKKEKQIRDLETQVEHLQNKLDHIRWILEN